jgi:hypothetical protein
VSQTQYAAAAHRPEGNRAELVYRYFMAVPRPPMRPDRIVPGLALGFGGLLLLTGLGQLLAGPFIYFLIMGFLPACAGGVLTGYGYLRLTRGKQEWEQLQASYQAALADYGGKPSGQQMDTWLAESVEDAKREGLRRLDLTSDQLSGARPGVVGAEPLAVLGLPDRTYEVFFARDAHDGRARFSCYAVTVIYLTGWKLCAFQCVLDMATGALYGETTREFHYQHINTIKTQSDRVALPGAFQYEGHHASEADNWIRDPQGYAVHVTSEQTLYIGVASDRLSLTVGISDEQQFGSSDPTMTEMRSRADLTIQQVRQQLQYHNQRGRGGIGSLDDEDPLGP